MLLLLLLLLAWQYWYWKGRRQSMRRRHHADELRRSSSSPSFLRDCFFCCFKIKRSLEFMVGSRDVIEFLLCSCSERNNLLFVGE
jgi:hypothetical protein